MHGSMERSMKSSWQVLKTVLRAALWRPTANVASAAPNAAFGALIAGCIALIALWVGLEFWRAAPSFRFNIYGFNAQIAWLALCLTVSAFFVKPGRRLAFLTALVALSIVIDVVGEVYGFYVGK